MEAHWLTTWRKAPVQESTTGLSILREEEEDGAPTPKAAFPGETLTKDLPPRWTRPLAALSMVPEMMFSTENMLKRWKDKEEIHEEIEVSEEFRMLTGVIISRTAFVTSFEEGNRSLT